MCFSLLRCEVLVHNGSPFIVLYKDELLVGVPTAFAAL
jgi:hypothetical protein